MNQARLNRVFLVGCPRSGTTLLQSLLAANTGVASFPETHFFDLLFGERLSPTILGVASRYAKSYWKVFLEEIGHPEMLSRLPNNAFLVQQFTRSFVDVLDDLTLGQGKIVWIEKTPRHLHFIKHIERQISETKFVHIVRNGSDVIASLYDMAITYPEGWAAEYKDIDKCIGRWVTDVRVSLRYARKHNHFLASYDQLISHPETSLLKLCTFLDIPYEKTMLIDYPMAAARMILKAEPWKAQAMKPIRPMNRLKFHELFDESQRQYIMEAIPEDLREANNDNFKL